MPRDIDPHRADRHPRAADPFPEVPDSSLHVTTHEPARAAPGGSTWRPVSPEPTDHAPHVPAHRQARGRPFPRASRPEKQAAAPFPAGDHPVGRWWPTIVPQVITQSRDCRGPVPAPRAPVPAARAPRSGSPCPSSGSERPSFGSERPQSGSPAPTCDSPRLNLRAAWTSSGSSSSLVPATPSLRQFPRRVPAQSQRVEPM